MSPRVGQIRRRDANEKAIRTALAAVGAQITQVSGPGAPDLLVRWQGRLYAFEIKTNRGQQTDAQVVTDWPIIRSVSEALETLGIDSDPTREVIR